MLHFFQHWSPSAGVPSGSVKKMVVVLIVAGGH